MRRGTSLLVVTAILASMGCDTSRRPLTYNGRMKMDCDTTSSLKPKPPIGERVVEVTYNGGCPIVQRCDGRNVGAMGNPKHTTHMVCDFGRQGTAFEILCNSKADERTCDFSWTTKLTHGRYSSTGVCNGRTGFALFTNGLRAKVRVSYRIRNEGSCDIDLACGMNTAFIPLDKGQEKIVPCELSAGDSLSGVCKSGGEECKASYMFLGYLRIR